MTGFSTDMREAGRATFWLCLLVACGLLLVVGANAHLIYVASISQPACVSHLRHGDGYSEPGSYSAAQSSCSSPRHTSQSSVSEDREP
jgi:hypothetical protein